MKRMILGMTAMVLLAPTVAEANFFRWWGGPRVTTAYYYPVTTAYYYPAPVVYYSPAVSVVYPCPPPVVVRPATPAVKGWATPQSAPASKPPEPPLAPPPGNQNSGGQTIPDPAPVTPPPGAPTPGVSEIRYYDAYAAAGREPARGDDPRCSVAFWNLSDRDFVIVADGKRLMLPRGKSTAVTLERKFTWQVEGRHPLVELVPENESALDIVIRR